MRDPGSVDKVRKTPNIDLGACFTCMYTHTCTYTHANKHITHVYHIQIMYRKEKKVI